MSDQWPPRPPGDDEPTRAPRRPAGRGAVPPSVQPPEAQGPEAQGPGAPGSGAPAPGAPEAPRPGPSAPAPRQPDAPEGTEAQSTAPPRRRSSNRRALTIAGLVVAGFLVIVALVGGGAGRPGSPTFPPVGATTAPAGAASAATRASLAAAFTAQGLQIDDVLAPFRPAEAPRLAAAPRIVVRAVLPSDPDHGRVVIYEFLDSASATAAAQEQATYLKSGVALVQFPPQTRFLLRVVGSTVVFYAWSADNSPDPAGVNAVATAVESIGFGVPVPN